MRHLNIALLGPLVSATQEQDNCFAIRRPVLEDLNESHCSLSATACKRRDRGIDAISKAALRD
jgi:hypothetical protein